MLISSIHNLKKAIEEVAPFCAGWALTDDADDLESLSGAKRRKLMYREFDIPKRSGGTRRITAPVGKLKDIQKCISVILSPYYQAPDCAHGFTEGRSVVSNAQMHVDKNYVLNIDLKDFFPTISCTRISNALGHLGFNDEVSDVIARLCTIPMRDEQKQVWRSVLPQGSPASPILSNIVCIPLDKKLTDLARRYGLTYSRYADDITFSSNHSVYSRDDSFLRELEEIVRSSGFKINDKKTRLQKRGSRQEVTGLIVGEKVNTYRQFTKNLRAAVFHAETNGCSRSDYNNIMGRISYLAMVKGVDDHLVTRFRRIMSMVETHNH